MNWKHLFKSCLNWQGIRYTENGWLNYGITFRSKLRLPELLKLIHFQKRKLDDFYLPQFKDRKYIYSIRIAADLGKNSVRKPSRETHFNPRKIEVWDRLWYWYFTTVLFTNICLEVCRHGGKSGVRLRRPQWKARESSVRRKWQGERSGRGRRRHQATRRHGTTRIRTKTIIESPRHTTTQDHITTTAHRSRTAPLPTDPVVGDPDHRQRRGQNGLPC